jgi:hypothetical protein
MKIKMKTLVALFVAAIAFSGSAASGQDTSATQPIQLQDWQNNDFTNKVVVATPDFYTNNQAAIAADAQYRIQEEGPVKGAEALQHSARIEPHPPTAVLEADPWVQQDHPWDINTNSPTITPP